MDTLKEKKKDESPGTGRLIRSPRNGDMDTFQWLRLKLSEIFLFRYWHLLTSLGAWCRYNQSPRLLSESTPTPSKKRIRLRTNKTVLKKFLRETLENFLGIMERIKIISKVAATRVANSNRELLLFLTPSRRNYREKEWMSFHP